MKEKGEYIIGDGKRKSEEEVGQIGEDGKTFLYVEMTFMSEV